MGAKSGSMPFSAMTLVSACGMWAMLVTTAPLAEQTGSRGENTPSTPNISMNQRFLRGGVVAGAGHGTGMADGAGELGLPAADDAGDDRLFRLQAQLVVAAGLGVHHGGLAALVVAERVDELGRGEVDVDVLAARDRGRGAPAGSGQIVGDGSGEVAGVGEDRDRALEQGLARIVAAQRTADPHPVPGVGHAQAVGAEDIDAVGLADGADLARIVDRDLLGDDDDLLEVRD